MYKTFYIILLLLCIYCNNPQISEVPGCTNKNACNFDPSANLDDDSCEFSEENYDCDNNCLVNADCAGVCGGSSAVDECGICGGNGIGDYDCNGDCIAGIDCLGVCGGNAVQDICGICNGNVANLSDCPLYCFAGTIDDCGICNGNNMSSDGDAWDCPPGTGDEFECMDIMDLPEDRCDCTGRREDCAGVCGGFSTSDACGNCGVGYIANYCYDCLGEPNGDAVIDCAGVCGGTAVEDDCGVCGGSTISPYALIWEDLFEGDGLDLDKWNIEEWPPGAFNEEEQAYTDEIDNIFLQDSSLHIRALRETYDPDENGVADALYTSGRISTKHKADWQYAKVEVKAQLPLGEGTWPAIWMLPTENIYGGWPESGEIDIMEYVGHNPGRVHSSVHNATYHQDLPPQQTSSFYVGDVDSWHVYSMIWRRDKITFYVDDEEIMVYDNLETGFELWPFDQEFHLLLNLAIGGTWGGTVTPEIFPVEFIIDYVKVYQNSCD